MPSLATCVRPQLASSCFCCTENYNTIHNRPREQAARVWLHLQATLASGHTCLSRWCWHAFTSKHECRLLALASSFRDFAMLISRGSAHMPEAYSSILAALNLLTCSPKLAAITPFSLNLQAISFLCMTFQSPFSPCSQQYRLFYLEQNWAVQRGREKGKKKKCSKISLLDTCTCLAASTDLIPAELSKKPLPLQPALRYFCCFWMQRKFSGLTKKGIFLCTKMF